MPWPEISPSNFVSRLTVDGIPGALICDAVLRNGKVEILVGHDERIVPGASANLNGRRCTIATVADPHDQADDPHAGNWMIVTID